MVDRLDRPRRRGCARVRRRLDRRPRAPRDLQRAPHHDRRRVVGHHRLCLVVGGGSCCSRRSPAERTRGCSSSSDSPSSLARSCAGASHETASSMVARCLQGAGAALMLGASLPVLIALQGSAAAGRRLWTGAGVIGAVVGPAVGGLLTQVFDWRAIFYLQAPVAALALVGVLTERARKRGPVDPSIHLGGASVASPSGPTSRSRFVGTASVGALFLGVLLVVEVWRYEPLAGALVVSALPVATLAAGAGCAGAAYGSPDRRGGIDRRGSCRAPRAVARVEPRGTSVRRSRSSAPASAW